METEDKRSETETAHGRRETADVRLLAVSHNMFSGQIGYQPKIVYTVDDNSCAFAYHPPAIAISPHEKLNVLLLKH